MDDEKTSRVIARQQESFARLAESQATVAIGEAALTVLARDGAVTLDSLLAWLAAPVSNPHLAHRNATAHTALLAACPTPASPVPR